MQLLARVPELNGVIIFIEHNASDSRSIPRDYCRRAIFRIDGGAGVENRIPQEVERAPQADFRQLRPKPAAPAIRDVTGCATAFAVVNRLACLRVAGGLLFCPGSANPAHVGDDSP